MKTRRIVKLFRARRATLRVIGTSATGFQLAAEIEKGLPNFGTTKILVPFGVVHPKQTIAIQHGESQFGLKAKKLVAKEAA